MSKIGSEDVKNGENGDKVFKDFYNSYSLSLGFNHRAYGSTSNNIDRQNIQKSLQFRIYDLLQNFFLSKHYRKVNTTIVFHIYFILLKKIEITSEEILCVNTQNE